MLLLASTMLGLLLLGMFVRDTEVQAAPRVDMLKVCQDSGSEIEAADLPNVVEPGACDLRDTVVTDNGIGVQLPERGEGVNAEMLTTTGVREIEVLRYEDGTVEIKHVGEEPGVGGEEARTGFAAGGPNECRDSAFTNQSYRVVGGLRYYINLRTTPPELTPRSASLAIRKGGANVTSTRNVCRLGDRVPAGLAYAGRTGAPANIRGTVCGGNDGLSVAAFARRPKGNLALTCTFFNIEPGYGRVTASDVEIARGTVQWTTNPGARSCRNKFDLESVMTHERGHTFGLGHVSESAHGNLTMSPRIEGPCEGSWRTLGRGDVLGLDGKY